MAASSDSQPSHDSPREPETSCRGKTYIAWKYAREEKDPLTKKRSITCLVCFKKIMDGGINRMKKHLAGQRGEIAPCKRVSPDVRYQMLESLKETSTKKRQREVEADDDQGKSHLVKELDFDAIDLTEDLVVDDDPDQINVDELEAIATDVTIPIFEMKLGDTMIYHKQEQMRLVEMLLASGMSLITMMIWRWKMIGCLNATT
ncbi:uncharacterized protein LOC113354413 isoform X2 [Papaver somniferum]|uniref:uncharacterized protein LOC113354412 isoform X2 n=1 Tax=Papaver somniferum TaxID=3469 RepID=UPI000E6FA1C1|nr:uncharacterized protein LOC113354412 isoform X2 [Papaver somniferum]XP_026453536.1 uncharacterized protein LOC113354413 isoform X2 [Papaver somniferum]